MGKGNQPLMGCSSGEGGGRLAQYEVKAQWGFASFAQLPTLKRRV